MNEIKFMVWDKEEKKIKPCLGLSFLEGGDIHANYGFNADYGPSFSYHTPAQYELMQYIGEHDKNNKEIYTGHIVRYKGENWAVKREGWCFHLCREGSNSLIIGSESYSKEVEIIGNIYENPELLKSVKSV